MDTLYILDGYGLIYRSYYAFQGKAITNPQGENVAAILAFYRSFFLFLKTYQPKHFIVALDSKGKTFRDEIYSEYKANRQKAPEDLHSQTAIIEEILEALCIKTLRADGFEADDIIATICKNRTKQHLTTIIISSDKDLMQLVNPLTTMLRPTSKGGGGFDTYNEEAVKTEKGVWPKQINDYLAIVGDSSDNIPGVAGLGPKAAEKLLQEYETLENIYQNIDQVKPEGYKTKLINCKELAFLSQQLACLHYQVPISFTEEESSTQNLNYKATISLFSQYGLPSLATEMAGRGKGDSPSSLPKKEQTLVPLNPLLNYQPLEDQNLKSYNAGQQNYRCINTLEQLEQWLAEILQAEIFAFDCETDGLDMNLANPVGFSFSHKVGEAVYIPIKATMFDTVLPEEVVKLALRKVLYRAEAHIVGQNIKFDYKILHRFGLTFQPYFDTMVAASLLDSESLVNMDFLAERYLHYKTVHFEEVVPKNSTFDTVPLDKATIYAAEDADITLQLYHHLQPLLKEKKVDTLFWQLEMPLITILAGMELQGIKIDTPHLHQFNLKLKNDLALLTQKIEEQAGCSFNIASPKQLGEVLFEKLKLPEIKKRSTDESVLLQLKGKHPIIDYLLDYRKTAKLISTYTEVLIKQVDSQSRIHTDYVQNGAATGRMSSKNPNLQNIPVRDENGRLIRTAFVAQEGHKLITADYSQIELVVLAHLADDPFMLAVFKEGRDLHRETAAFIFNTTPDQVSTAQRSAAKAINFGIIYGMSAFRLSQELEISRNEAATYIENYFGRYQQVKKLMDRIVSEATQRGGVRTLMGRFRAIPDLFSANANTRQGGVRQAVNTVIQGSSADIVKQAMLNIDRSLTTAQLKSKILLQVHDEIIVESPEAEVDQVKTLLQQQMIKAASDLKPSITLKVGLEVGNNWGEFHAG